MEIEVKAFIETPILEHSEVNQSKVLEPEEKGPQSPNPKIFSPFGMNMTMLSGVALKRTGSSPSKSFCTPKQVKEKSEPVTEPVTEHATNNALTVPEVILRPNIVDSHINDESENVGSTPSLTNTQKTEDTHTNGGSEMTEFRPEVKFTRFQSAVNKVIIDSKREENRRNSYEFKSKYEEKTTPISPNTFGTKLRMTGMLKTPENATSEPIVEKHVESSPESSAGNMREENETKSTPKTLKEKIAEIEARKNAPSQSGLKDFRSVLKKNANTTA